MKISGTKITDAEIKAHNVQTKFGDLTLYKKFYVDIPLEDIEVIEYWINVEDQKSMKVASIAAPLDKILDSVFETLHAKLASTDNDVSLGCIEASVKQILGILRYTNFGTYLEIQDRFNSYSDDPIELPSKNILAEIDGTTYLMVLRFPKLVELTVEKIYTLSKI
jgi:hypothetical protein